VVIARHGESGRWRGVGLGARLLLDRDEGALAARESAVACATTGPFGVRALATMLRRWPTTCVVTTGPAAATAAGVRIATPGERLAGILGLWLRLYGAEARRVGVFLLIGLLGMALNSAVTAFGRNVLSLHYLLAAVVATEVTSTCCFCLIEANVFRDREPDRSFGVRLLLFLAMNNAAFVLRGPMMYVLTSGIGVHYLISNLASIVTFTVVRYVVSALWIWRPRSSTAPSRSKHRAAALVGSAGERAPLRAIETAPSVGAQAASPGDALACTEETVVWGK